MTLLLPSSQDGPESSPHLLRADGDGSRQAAEEVAPWRAPAIRLAPGPALDLLLALPAEPISRVAVGDSLRFLAEAAKLALELLARGRLTPGLWARGEGWVAGWQPVLEDAEDAERLRILVEAIPPPVRAEASGSREGHPAESVVGDVLAAFVDASARKWAARGLGVDRRSRAGRSATGAWLAALTARDPVVRADPRELAALAERLDDWREAGLASAQTGTFRTCFRLHPPGQVGALDSGGGPEDADGSEERGGEAMHSSPWRVEILLQAKDDPSVLVPAEEVWSANGEPLTALGRKLRDPHERLLSGLGIALRHWPDLEPALREPAPTGVDLTLEQAYEFLGDAAPALEQAGYSILAPARARLTSKLRLRPLEEEWEEGSGLLGLDGLCAYEWRVAVGDRSLTGEELRELAARKMPLVRAKGQWIMLRPEEIEAALSFLEQTAAAGEAPAGELLRTGLGLDGANAAPDLELGGIEADGWLGDLLGANGERRLEPVEAPAAFRGTLRPYQARGLAWLSFLSGLGLGACLADDMGLGKTIQLLALLLAEREGRRRPGPTLLVCPMSVAGNWQREAERFAPELRTQLHHGPERLRDHAFARAARAADLVITTYALAHRDAETLGAVKWERVALDEAQNIKTRSAKQTRAIRSLRARHRVALTGTPVENRLSELHSIMDFLNPGLLGSADRFEERFARPIERYRDGAAAETLKRATGPFILRRLKTDRTIIDDLPAKIEIKVPCNLTREQATLYRAVVDDMLERVEQAEGIGRSGIILAAMMKLKQVCNHPAHVLGDRSRLEGRSGKLTRLEQILDEALAAGDKALVFTQFAEFGQMLRAHLQEQLGRETLFLHGGTSRTAREEMIRRFQEEGDPALFVLSLKAGGTGLNLTAANHVIHFDRWWNPAVEDQATDRAFRIGQRKDVQVRKLCCVGTLEERIDRLIEEKKDLAERIVGSGEGWLTELDTGRLRELVALGSEAVAEG